MHSFRTALAQLYRFRRPLFVFEILYKLMTVLVLAPACGGLIQLAIQAASLKYLTNSNLLQFLRSPWTILFLTAVLIIASLYILFEIGAVCTCYAQPKEQPFRQTMRAMIRGGLASLGHFFTGGGPLLVLHLLVMIPLMQFSTASGIFTSLGLPDFLSYYVTRKKLLLVLYLGAVVLCCLLSVRWIFSSVLFTQNACSFRSARKCSAKLVKGKFWATFCSVLLWNLCYFAVVMTVLLVLSLGVMLILYAIHHGDFPVVRATGVVKLMLQIVLWSVSFFSVPICMSHVTALLKKRCIQRPEVILPEPQVRTHRFTGPFRRGTAVITALCFTVSALALHVSYLYSVFTGQSRLQLTMYQMPAITAHRGLSSKAPENTLYAFEEAIQAGADWIELDVQQTRDGVLVVMHDSNLKRTTGVNRNIWDVTYDEIRDLDAGSWFDGAYANARIPTLEEVLQFVDGRAALNVEIKPTDHTSETLESDVAELLTAYGYEDDCYVTSFSYSALKKIKQANPELRTGYIMSVAYGQFYQLQYADAFSLNKAFVTSQVVHAAHQAGKEVFAWTVNREAEVRSLYQLHVDSIITDNPVMAQKTIAESSTSDMLWAVLL